MVCACGSEAAAPTMGNRHHVKFSMVDQGRVSAEDGEPGPAGALDVVVRGWREGSRRNSALRPVAQLQLTREVYTEKSRSCISGIKGNVGQRDIVSGGLWKTIWCTGQIDAG